MYEATRQHTGTFVIMAKVLKQKISIKINRNRCNHFFKISMLPSISSTFPFSTLLCPITSIATDSAEELDKAGLLKMREGRDEFKFEEALMGPSGHVPCPEWL